MQTIQKHIILLTAILLWSCVSVFASEVDMAHFMRDSYASGERTVKSSGENAAMFVASHRYSVSEKGSFEWNYPIKKNGYSPSKMRFK